MPACLLLAVGWGVSFVAESALAVADVRRAVVPSGGGRPGFTSLEPATTGIAFTNRLEIPRALRNRNLMNGSGVAAGDVDGDGRCDLFFCSITGPNALYRNLGDWHFVDASASAGVAGGGWASTGAVLADLDGDGDLELLVSTLGAGVRCYRNDGAGHFTEVTAESGLTSSTGSTSLVLGDVDGDGDLDLYVVNYGAESVLRSGGRAEVRRVNGQWEFTGPNAHRLRYVDGQVEEVGEAGVLYLNDGRGHFQPVPWNSDAFLGIDGRPKPPPLDYGLGAQMRDVNGDGAPDLYICNDFQMPDRLWLNDGRGHFREAPFPVLRKFPFSSMGVDFADLDRDGRLDFFVVEMASRDPERALRQVGGMAPYPNPPGRFEGRNQVLRNVLYHANGDGTWSDVTEFAGLAATDWSWQPTFLDVDLDGFEDLLVVNGMLFDTQDRDALARVNSLGRQPPEAARTNLLLYPPFPSPNLAFRNRGGLRFEEISAGWGFHSTRISQGIALADLDGDGDADVVINCLNDGALVLRNDTAAPRVAVRLKGRPPNTRGIGARVVVEGGPVRQEQEILAGGRYLSSDDSFRTFAVGTATSVTVQVTWRSGRSTTVKEVRPNTWLTVSEADAAAPATDPAPAAPRAWFAPATDTLGHVHHEVPFDDFARQPLLPRQLSTLGPGVAWLDLDGDGRDELLIGTGRGGAPGAYRFGADRRPVRLGTDWKAPDDVVGLTGWATAEGRPAVLAAVSGYETAAVEARLYEWMVDSGSTNLVVRPLAGLPALPAGLGPIAAADVEGDGDLDLFVGSRVEPGGYPRAAASRLYRRDAGGWSLDAEAGRLLTDAGMVSAAVWSDLEDDGFPELILACEWGPIRILRNDRGRWRTWDPEVLIPGTTATRVPLSRLTGWWTSVTTGDFDGDGRLDVVAGNWGLNSGYRASLDHPARLSFLGPGSGFEHRELIESQFVPESGRELPRRSLNALGQAFPFLAGAFPSHAAFAAGGMEGLISALPIAPEVVTAATLESTLFLNRTTGWEAVALPPEAQFAPAFGLVPADVDGDGMLDLFVAQNFFAMRVEWPRNEAGRSVWLKGDGSGHFRAMTSGESGVVIHGEQRGAALGDPGGDGELVLAVAQDGAPTTLWRRSESAPVPVLAVAGPAGNPLGWGVTARLRRAGRDGPVRELKAVSGYWSVDGARMRFPGGIRPESVRLRWPGGREESLPWPADGATVTAGMGKVSALGR